MTKNEALRLALEALEWQQEMLYTAMQYSAAKGMTFLGHPPNPNEAITAIKAALEAKDELVQNQLMALIDENQRLRAELKFNTTPPQRKPLTDEEIERIYNRYGGEMINCARAIERAHGIKGEA